MNNGEESFEGPSRGDQLSEDRCWVCYLLRSEWSSEGHSSSVKKTKKKSWTWTPFILRLQLDVYILATYMIYIDCSQWLKDTRIEFTSVVWGCSPVVQYLLHMWEALDSSSLVKRRKELNIIKNNWKTLSIIQWKTHLLAVPKYVRETTVVIKFSVGVLDCADLNNKGLCKEAF